MKLVVEEVILHGGDKLIGATLFENGKVVGSFRIDDVEYNTVNVTDDEKLSNELRIMEKQMEEENF